MTDTLPGRTLRHPLTLWIAFVLVHLVVGLIALSSPAGTGDVTFVYPFWVEWGLRTGQWVGIQTAWVYPILALPPMIAAHAFGASVMAPVWLCLVMVADAVAFAFLTGFGRDRRMAVLAWWWLGFLLLLGPIALTRIDSFTAPFVIPGVLLLARSPRVAAALLTIAAWIKVWPAAIVLAAVVAMRRRLAVLGYAVLVSALIAIVVVAIGGGANLFSFVTAQSGRGLQVESVLATSWLWRALLHPGDTKVYYDTTILTYQVHGPGVATAAEVANPVLAIVVLAVLVLSVLAARRGVPAPELLPVMALGFTVALIVADKVGSPQYAGWLAAPVLLGMATRLTGRGIRFVVPAVAGLVIAGLTQLVYPTFYDQLLALDPSMLVVLTVRNLLYIALLAWAFARLALLLRRPPLRDEGDWLPGAWPFRVVGA